MSHFPGIPCFSAYERLKKLCTYTVLGSFIANILMPSYMLASTETMPSHDNSLASGRFRTGIMLRISKPFAVSPSLDDLIDESNLFQPISDDELDESQYELSDTASQGSDDASLTGIIALDDLWELAKPAISNPTPPVPGSPVPSCLDVLIAKNSGYLFTRESDDYLRVSCDPSISPDLRLRDILHLPYEGAGVILDGLGSVAGVAVYNAKEIQIRGESSIGRLVLGAQSDEMTASLPVKMTLDKDAKLGVNLLELNHTHAVLHGTTDLLGECKVILNHSSVEQHGACKSEEGQVNFEGHGKANWHVFSDKGAVLSAQKGSIQACDVNLINEGVVHARETLDWKSAQITNTGTIVGQEGVVLTAEQGQNAGRIASTQGGVEMSAAIKTLASGSIESNQGVSFKGDRTKDVVLEGTINAKTLKVDGKNLTNKATVEVSEANLAISGTLDQQKVIHSNHLTFTGNRIINQGDTNIGELTLTQKVDIEQRSGKFVVEKAEGEGEAVAKIGILQNEKGQMEIKAGSLHVGQFKDVAGTETLLPKVTMDQKDGVIYGHVDIKHFNHSEGAERGAWIIGGKLIIRDGFFRVDSADVLGKFSLGGSCTENLTSVIQGQKILWDYKDGKLNMCVPLYGVQPSTREEKKAYIRQLFEANKKDIRATFTQDGVVMWDYFHMLAWMTKKDYLLERPQYSWMMDEMLKNAGAWEWGTRERTPAENMAHDIFENQRRDKCQFIYEKHRVEIAKSCPSGSNWHDYYRMLRWLEKSMFLVKNPGYGWLLEELREKGGHWGWNHISRDTESVAFSDRFFQTHKKDLMKAFYQQHADKIEKVGSSRMHSYYKTLAWMERERFVERNHQYGWILPEFIRDAGHWGWSKDGRTASVEEMDALNEFMGRARPTNHRLGKLSVLPGGTFQVLSGMSASIRDIKNKGRIESYHQALSLVNTTKLLLGVIEMNNDELIVEADDGAELIDYVEKSAHQWLMHKLRLHTKRFHLTRNWHFTYRNEDGSHAPFMMGNEAEKVWRELPKWESEQQAREAATKKREYRLPIELTIDAVEFINQALLKVRGKLNILVQKDLDNTQGKIHASRVVGKSYAGKIRVGAPMMDSRHIYYGYGNTHFSWYTPNGSYLVSDDDMLLSAADGIELDCGSVEAYGYAEFISEKPILCTASRLYVLKGASFKAPQLIWNRKPIEQRNHVVNTPQHWENQWLQALTSRESYLFCGGPVNIQAADLQNGLIRLEGSTWIVSGNLSINSCVMEPGRPSPYISLVCLESNYHTEKHDKFPENYTRQYESAPSSISTSGRFDAQFADMFMGSSKIVAAAMNLTGQNAYINGGAHIRSIGQAVKHDVISLLEGIQQVLGGAAVVRGQQDNPYVVMSRQSLEGALASAPNLPVVVPACEMGATQALIQTTHQGLMRDPEDEDSASYPQLEMRIPKDRIGFRMVCDRISMAQGISSTLNRLFTQHYVHPFMSQEQSLKQFIEDILGLAQGREVLTLEEIKAYGKPALAYMLQTVRYIHPDTSKEVSETAFIPHLFNIESNPALDAPGASLVSTHGDMNLSVANDLYARGVNVMARDGEAAADIALIAGRRQTHRGVKMDGNNIACVAGHGIEVQEDQHVRHETHHEGKCTVESVITTSIANEYKGKNVVFMTPQGSLIFQNIIVTAEKFKATAPEGVVEFLAGVNSEQRSILEKGGNFFIEKIRQTTETHVNYIGCDLDKVGAIEVDAMSAFYQRAKSSAMEWTSRIAMMKPGTDVSSVVLQDIHDVQTKEQRGLSAAFGILVGLSINAMVPGIGSSFWSAFSTLGSVCGRAALVCMLSMTSQALAKNNGNLGNTLDDLTGDQAFKTMLVAVGTAGITHSVCGALPIPADAMGVVRHGLPALVRETTNVSLQALTSRQGGDVGRSVMNITGDIAQGMAAEGVGRAVDSGSIGKAAAVGVHAVIGAGAHVIRGGDIQQAGIVGVATGLAEGAMYACVDPEEVAEKVFKEHSKATPQERERYFNEEIRTYREMAHITAATLATVATSSAEVGYATSHSAQMAIDNNFSNLVIGAGLTLNTLKPYYDAYDAAGGGDAGYKAVTDLLAANGGGGKLGVEIALNFVGGAVVMKAGGKLVQFVKGRAMQFIRGDKVAKVEKAQKFLEQTKVEDKRTVEALNHNLLPAPKMGDHHIFPQQFRKFFEKKGIEIDSHTVSLTERMHLREIHGKGISTPGKWNIQWAKFIEKNPDADIKQIYQFAGKLMDKYGINNVSIHGYRR